MTPVERLEAAIVVLEGRRADADLIEAADPRDQEYYKLLHRTVDPQLEIMRGAVRYMQAFGDTAHEYVLALADAILGGAS